MSTSSMSSIPYLSLPNPKLTFSSFRPLSFSSSSSSSSSASSSFSCSSFSKHSNGQRSNQKLSIFACSTSPFIGRVGLQGRQGNASMLSFGINPNDIAHTGKNSNTDSSSSSLSHILSATLPFVVAATAIAALAQPSTFTWVSKELYAPALGGIIPLPLTVGFIAQYVLKPALGVLIAGAFGMSRTFYAGFVLTSCVAGAQLSSYASFLSKGDVALSILLTSSTTIASVLVTPLLTGLLIGSVVPVDAVAMSKSILQVVLVPVTLGLVLNTYAKPVVTVLEPVMPFVAMICTSMCIGSPLAINRNQILSAEGLRLVLPIFMFHAVAFTVGYWVSKIPVFRQEEEVSRTISLCTGMQSSTLAGLLATQFLGSSQAVPPACSVVAMAIMGLCLASFWGSGYRIRDLPSLLMPESSSTVKA
ncbi:putative sodium/metabolite cotransporter bass3 [Quercus suber]|uniref:Sodium/metabolite cotransporter bass3 n=1 Tax=Quercus suber TaxID=58331 RepID=A0AAW0IRE1_QUESU